MICTFHSEKSMLDLLFYIKKIEKLDSFFIYSLKMNITTYYANTPPEIKYFLQLMNIMFKNILIAAIHICPTKMAGRMKKRVNWSQPDPDGYQN